uniref:EamA domain-containing protein n=1 Tax=Clastoptera arizonana TaxID=38151 RepID=A0A1B6DHG4_9HEMI
MAWTKYQVILALVMVATGSINTLTTKWADHLQSVGSNGKSHNFNHPFVQSFSMFLGEMLCLLAFKVIYFFYIRRQEGSLEDNQIVRGNQDFNPLIFLPPAMCDMIATSLMYIGLTLTYASSFQMLRGSVIIFVAFLSMAFLERKIAIKQWVGIVHVILGLLIVGYSDFLIKGGHSSEANDINGVITGDLLIVMAQVITALQMVYEEKYVTTRDIPPLQAVGWEGVFGATFLGLLLVPFSFITVPYPFANNSNMTLEDVIDALVQMSNNFFIIVSLAGTIFSIAFFNFAGVSVTKEMSATTRMILDSVRTLFIWLFSLYFAWQQFHPLQIVGFAFLIAGMCVYNNLIPSFSDLRQRFAPQEPLINQAADQP